MAHCNFNGPIGSVTTKDKAVTPKQRLPLPPEWNTAIPPQAISVVIKKYGNGIETSNPVWNKEWLKGLEAFVRAIVRDELGKD